MFMQNYSKNKLILVKYPFTDLSDDKIRPAVIISEGHYDDLFIVPLTSKTDFITEGEFVLTDWKKAGLNVTTAVKRGIFTIDSKLVVKEIGFLSNGDSEKLRSLIIFWLNLK